MPRYIGGTLTLDAGSVTDDHIDPATRLDADKLQHIHKPGTNFDLAVGATPVAREEIVFVAASAGTIRQFSALLNDTGSSVDVDFDLKVNGSSVLSSVVNITHATGDRASVDGTISTPTIAADDVISIELLTTSTTGAQGPFAYAVIEETT